MLFLKSFLSVAVTVVMVVEGCWAAPSSYDNTRIVNGTEAEDGEFPFIVSIRISSTGQHNCGGSIISPDYILTAAHCALSQPSKYSVQYGTNQLSASGSNIVSVVKVVPHERFNPFVSTEFDIAVMKVSRP
jgi:trypsin